MSYLDRPRLVFSGSFIADPSTVNNVPANYDPLVTAKDPGWNPGGTGHWKLLGCTVTAALYADGTAATSATEDPVVGAQVVGNPKGSPGKLVDLDPEQQMVSQIWGFTVQLATSSGAPLLTGRYAVAAFTDIWFRAVDAGSGGDAPMGAAYQSVLGPLAWGDVAPSRFLRELREVSPERVSIKFNLDGINMQAGSPTFTQGRLVGAIGPAHAGEPDGFVAGRLLRSAPGNAADPQPIVLQGTPPASPTFFAPARVEAGRGIARIDLGNSLSTTTPGGPLNPALGDLRLAVLPAGAGPQLLGAIAWQAADWYATTAGIVELPLSAAQLATVAVSPLALVQVGAAGEPVILLRENPQGAFVRAESFVFRLNPGETAEVALRATRFGIPAARQTIGLRLAPEYVDQIQSPPNPDDIPIGRPESALRFPPRVTTDARGRATFTLATADPGNPRRFIDGQVYGIVYLWGDDEGADHWHDPTSFLSVLAFDGLPPLDHPTWKDVQPILGQYASLYPFMTTRIVDLGSYAAVKQNLASIERVLSLPKDDPGYMQVTRDMSRDRLARVLRWIEQGAPE